MKQTQNQNHSYQIEVFTPRAVGERLQVSMATLAKWRSQRIGPKFLKIGGLVRYSNTSLNDWLISAEARQNDQ